MASSRILEPREGTRIADGAMSLRDFLFGRPLATEEDACERIGPAAGVGVLGLDAIASAAYGPEALLTVLMPLGAAGPRHAVPLPS